MLFLAGFFKTKVPFALSYAICHSVARENTEALPNRHEISCKMPNTPNVHCYTEKLTL